MTWEDVLAVGLALPEMEASTSYGTPALKLRVATLLALLLRHSCE